MHILLADDDADNRLAMKMLLELHGHHLEVAENGQQAVELATQRPPHVVVMDINMPVMDGIAATRLLRQRAGTLAVPVVCLPAYLAQSEWCAKAYEAGWIACFAKPVHWTILLCSWRGASSAARAARIKDNGLRTACRYERGRRTANVVSAPSDRASMSPP
jgi:CheY-like chemotaxis protein